MNKITHCPNCGRASFLDLMCADCTRAYNKGHSYAYKEAEEYRRQLGVMTIANNNLAEYAKEEYEQGKKDERKRIVEWIKRKEWKNAQFIIDGNEAELTVYVLTEGNLAELEKGDK